MKKLLLSSIVAGLLSTSAMAWDFCADYSKLAVLTGTTGTAIAIGTTTVAPAGIIVGAVINHLIDCDEVSETTINTTTDEPTVKTVSIDDAKPVYFGFDKYDLDATAKEVVTADAEVLKTIKEKIVIEGNADARGSDEYNYALGLKRAEAVKSALVNSGVTGELTTITYGESKPACTEQTEDCFAKNRRVELKTQK